MAPVEPTPTQYDRLHSFLASAFSPDTLHGLLLRLDGGRAVTYELPSAQEAPAVFFNRAAERLWQHGLVRAPLFELLLQCRPHRRNEILEVAVLFGVPLDQPSTTASSFTLLEAPALESPGAMVPTFGSWCRRNAWTLLALLALSVLGAGVALQLCPAAGNPNEPDPIRMAVKVGQAVLCAIALLYVAFSRTPDTSTLFGSSDTYSRMWKRLGALADTTSPAISTLRAAAGADPQTREAIAHWLDAAIDAREQMRRNWLWLWFSWMCLYVVAVMLEMGTPDFPPQMFAVMKVLLTALNNAAAACLFVGFWILSFITVPIPETERRDVVRPTTAGVGLVAASGVVLYAIAQLGFCFKALRTAAALDENALRANVEAVSNNFDVGSGLISSVVLAMFIGRMDSKFINVSWPVLMMLYLYAAVQPSWSYFELIRSSEPNSMAVSATSAEELLFLFAWIAKAVLFALFAWVFHTGRLDFYFLRVRRLQDRVAADWRALSG